MGKEGDVLEVYLLCLMLGYRGRYGSGSSGELRGLVTDTREKIRRIRGGDRELSPSWRPTGADRVGGGSDPWVRRLLLGAAACGGLALLLLVIFLFVGGAGVDEVRAAAGEIVG